MRVSRTWVTMCIRIILLCCRIRALRPTPTRIHTCILIRKRTRHVNKETNNTTTIHTGTTNTDTALADNAGNGHIPNTHTSPVRLVIHMIILIRSRDILRCTTQRLIRRLSRTIRRFHHRALSLILTVRRLITTWLSRPWVRIRRLRTRRRILGLLRLMDDTHSPQHCIICNYRC